MTTKINEGIPSHLEPSISVGHQQLMRGVYFCKLCDAAAHVMTCGRDPDCHLCGLKMVHREGIWDLNKRVWTFPDDVPEKIQFDSICYAILIVMGAFQLIQIVWWILIS